MRMSRNNVFERDSLSFIYSGLNSISDKGREQLKNIAQYLIAIQNHPGTSVPDNVYRDIIRDSTNDLLKGVK